MDKREFDVLCEWSPFQYRDNYKEVSSKKLARAAVEVAFRTKSLGALLGIAASSDHFSIEEDDLENVGFMLKELAFLSYGLVSVLSDRIEEDEDTEEDDDEPALLAEQGD